MAPAATPDMPAEPGRDIVDLEAEVAYWRDFYARTTATPDFDAYEPAIRLGIQARLHAHGRSFEEMDPGLGESYDLVRDASALEWTHARAIARASWLRIEERAAAAT